MDCEQELRRYRELKGMAAYIENELAMLRELQDDAAFRDEGIESGSLGGTGHAVSKGTARNSRVERCAVEQAAGGYDALAAEIKCLERKLIKLNYSIRRVEAMLCALTQRELLVVQKFYIEGYPWSDVVTYYKQEMPSPREADALKATRNTAMAKMKQIYDRCRITA
ncbi:MAG: hypothetical protein ACOYU3_09315 [Bacillota bacterium]